MNESTPLVVAYHEGGQMSAGDEQHYPKGWYLFNGETARPVVVVRPFSNDPLVVEDEFALKPFASTDGKV